MIDFEEVKKNNQHINILYKLLDSRKYSISHKLMPSKSDHRNFVKNQKENDTNAPAPVVSAVVPVVSEM